MESKANKKQVGGQHYQQQYQHWDMVADAPLNYFEGQVLKYLSRWRKKNGVEDVEKSLHYLEKLIELYQQRRLSLPVCPKFILALNRFKDEHECSPQEYDMFLIIFNYTTLDQLCGLRSLLQKFIEYIRSGRQATKAAKAK